MTDCLPGRRQGNAKWQGAGRVGGGQGANGPRNHLSTPSLGWALPTRLNLNIALGNSKSLKSHASVAGRRSHHQIGRRLPKQELRHICS